MNEKQQIVREIVEWVEPCSDIDPDILYNNFYRLSVPTARALLRAIISESFSQEQTV